MTSHLTVVEPGDERKPLIKVRREIADALRTIAGFAESGKGYRRGPLSYAPISAAVLVLFDADGEPSPIVFGFDGVSDEDRRTAIRQAGDALLLGLGDPWRYTGLLAKHWEERTGEPVTSRLELVRQGWLDEEQRHARMAAEDAAKKAAHERSHPYLCDCGERTKTAAGLARHKTGRSHTIWQSRQGAKQ